MALEKGIDVTANDFVTQSVVTNIENANNERAFNIPIESQQPNFLFYSSDDGSIKVQVAVGNETVWASQKGMAEIFDVDVRTVNEHLLNIFKSNELDELSVIRKFRITASDGKNYDTNLYNLDAIISVGYRINSYQATQFRKWATKILKEYLIKGFALNDERLKQGNQLFGKIILMNYLNVLEKLEHRNGDSIKR